MKAILVVGALFALAVPVATAQTIQPAVAPIAPAQPTAAAVLRAGTPVSFKLLEEVTTKDKAARVGQRINLEVSASVEVNGVTVIPAGTPAWAELTGVRNKGMWGKSGKLDAQMLFLRVNGRQIRLTGAFDDKGTTGTAAVVGSVVLLPLAGFFMTGTSAVLPKGGAVNGFIDEDVQLSFADTTSTPMQVPVAAPMSVSQSASPAEARTGE